MSHTLIQQVKLQLTYADSEGPMVCYQEEIQIVLGSIGKGYHFTPGVFMN